MSISKATIARTLKPKNSFHLHQLITAARPRLSAGGNSLIMPAGLAVTDICSALDALTSKSQSCQGPANQINIINVALAVSGFGPIPVMCPRYDKINYKLRIFAPRLSLLACRTLLQHAVLPLASLVVLSRLLSRRMRMPSSVL